MSLMRILVDVPDAAQTVADDMRLTGVAADAGRDIEALVSYLTGIGMGKPAGAKIRVNVGGAQAVNRITFASFADGDTVTTNGVVGTGRTTPTLATEWAVGASNEACSNNFRTFFNALTTAKLANTIRATRRATHTLSGFVDGDTITINGVIFTGKTTPTNSQIHFAIGGTDTLTAANLAALLNRDDNPVAIKGLVATSAAAVATITFDGTLTTSASAHSTVASDMVDLTAILSGTLGNLYTLAISAHGSVTGANFASGTEGTQADVTISSGR